MKNLHILVVEDNPINIAFIHRLLSEHKLSMDMARDGTQALEKLKNTAYNLVLIDLEMPGMNGYQITENIRKEMKNDVPIIAMTANSVAEEKKRCLDMGINDCISKPVSSELLFEKLHTIFPERYEQAEKTGDTTIPQKLVNLDFLIKNIGNKKAEIIDIIDIFCEQLPLDMEELSGAVANADYQNIRQYAHRMKSTLSFMGTEVMLGIAREIESLAREERGIEKIRLLYSSLTNYSKAVLKEAVEEKNNLAAHS